MKTIHKQMRRKKRIKRQKVVKQNAEKAFTKEDRLFNAETNIKNRYSHHTILGMPSFNQAEDVSMFS